MNAFGMVLSRLIVVLINAIFLWGACRLIYPHIPEVTVPNAIGISMLAWIIGAEFRSRIP